MFPSMHRAEADKLPHVPLDRLLPAYERMSGSMTPRGEWYRGEMNFTAQAKRDRRKSKPPRGLSSGG